MMTTTPNGLRLVARRATATLAFALLCLAWCLPARAQNPPTGPAGGDLSGTYPNPTLAADRVRKTGDTVTGTLEVTSPNTGGIVYPLVISSAGNSGLNRGVGMYFKIPAGGATSTLGGQVTSAWNGAGQAYLSFGVYNGSGVAEVFRLDGTGKVGIGTTAPGRALSIDGTAAPALGLGAGGTERLTLGVATAAGNWFAGSAVNDAAVRSEATDLWVGTFSGSKPIRFVTNNSQRVIIDGAGNVGVGTTPPNALYRLDVAGSVNASGGLCIGGTCKATWAEVITSQWANGAASSINYGAGNVGVGTSTPAYRFDVATPSSGTQLRFGIGASDSGGYLISTVASPAILAGGASWNGTSWVAKATSANIVSGQLGELTFSTNSGLTGGSTFTPAERMRISSAGNVGIGTATPSAALEVARAAGGNFNALHLYNASASPHNPSHSVSLTLGRGAEHMMGAITSSNKATGTFGDGYLAFSVRRADAVGEKVRFDEEGRVGIGKTNPTEALDVVGNIKATGNIAARYQDVAEWVPSTQQLAAGTVVVLDAGRSNHVLASAAAYDTRVAGVVSAQPGVILGEGGEGKLMVATTGRVKVRVDATRASILVGDLLVTGEVEGVAMKGVPLNFGGTRPGTIIGRALEPLEKGVGEILVLLSLQ